MTELLDAPGGRIAFDVTGSGPLVVLSHGVGDRRQASRFLAQTLAVMATAQLMVALDVTVAGGFLKTEALT
jgi:predicted dienelactone hydrolase